MDKEVDAKSDALETPRFTNNTVSSQSLSISEKIKHSLDNDYVTDRQLIDRLCAIVSINRRNQKAIMSLYDKSAEKCAQKMVDIIYNEAPYHNDDATEVTETENDIANEKISHFYKELNEWVQQDDKNEKRLQAQEIIITAFERNDTDLDIDNLQLTSLPSVITELKQLQTINLRRNPLSKFPECLYSFTTLKSIDVQHTNLVKLTPGMRILIGKFNCHIIVDSDDDLTENSPNIQKELCHFADLFVDFESWCLKFDDDDFDPVNVENKDVLPHHVEEILTESYHEKMKPKTQDEFLESFGQCNFPNKRLLLLKDGSVNVIGCSSEFCSFFYKKESEDTLEFIYKNVDTMALLTPRNGNKDLSEFIKECSGNDQHRCTTIKLLPLVDFAPPRLEHYEIILEQLKSNRLISKSRPKTMMISCIAGEGRTGTCLAMLKLVDEFKLLPNSDKKDINSFNRDYSIAPHGGTFTRLHDNFKTTEFVGNIIDSIRLEEEKCLGKAISVETPDQISTLELMHLMLIVNKMQQEDPSITDDEILKFIYSKGFSKEFISSFCDSYFTKPAKGVLTEEDMLMAAERIVLRRIRNIHTII